MARIALHLFLAAFLALATLFCVVSFAAVRLSPEAAEARFRLLVDHGAARRAVGHGERALAMAIARRDRRASSGPGGALLAQLRADLADAYVSDGDHDRAAELYRAALMELAGVAFADPQRLAELADKLGRAELSRGRILAGVEIYFGFLEAAGDYAARSPEHTHEALGFDMGAWYAERARAAEALFAEDLTAARVRTAYVGGPVASRVAAAQKMAALGAFYASTPSGYNTAAALLAAAYDIRSSILGSEHEDTLQTMLMLAPVYANLGQLGDAERLYLRVFHSQERRQGANNPDLSLYLKLLAQIYERQARLTEAEALYEHIRSLFSDAYGAQRYAASRTSDPLTAIDRPVSGAFPLAAEYRPPDLVSAAGFGVPLSKPEGIEEMMVRLAPDAGDAAGVRNLPARLASLMSLCERQSGERLTLRSGFRSFATQQQLYALNGAAGRTAPAGASEHQSGLAVDIDVNGRFMRRSDRAYQCFQQNAFQYGFLLSYPQGNSYLPAEQSFEPWHWRYVGVETARLYREAGPLNKPLEFLAALPCYRELAARELSANASGQDVCLTETDNTDS